MNSVKISVINPGKMVNGKLPIMQGNVVMFSKSILLQQAISEIMCACVWFVYINGFIFWHEQKTSMLLSDIRLMFNCHHHTSVFPRLEGTIICVDFIVTTDTNLPLYNNTQML